MNALGLNHCPGLPRITGPVKLGFTKRPHGIARVAVVRRVIAELRGEREIRLAAVTMLFTDQPLTTSAGPAFEPLHESLPCRRAVHRPR